MRLCPIVIVALLAGLASGCSRVEAPPPVVRVEYRAPVLPPLARVACDKPAGLSDADLSEREVASLWSRDRVALRACETRRAAAVAAVDGAAK